MSSAETISQRQDREFMVPLFPRSPKAYRLNCRRIASKNKAISDEVNSVSPKIKNRPVRYAGSYIRSFWNAATSIDASALSPSNSHSALHIRKYALPCQRKYISPGGGGRQ